MSNEFDSPSNAVPAFHGYAPSEPLADEFSPPMTVAISRQTGARGRAVARRSAEILGWDLVTQEILEYSTSNPGIYPTFEEALSAPAEAWVDKRLVELTQLGLLLSAPDMEPLARTVLEIAARGRHVILGRGAGWIVPRPALLHVRLVAPERERIAYIAEIDRFSRPEAERYVRDLDAAREQMTSRLKASPLGDDINHELVLDSNSFGVEGCARVIVCALHEKQSQNARRA